jgi:cobalt/nickel transport system permease protein
MLSRGFRGEFHTRNGAKFGRDEILFVLGWSVIFMLLRFSNITRILGLAVTGGTS